MFVRYSVATSSNLGANNLLLFSALILQEFASSTLKLSFHLHLKISIFQHCSQFFSITSWIWYHGTMVLKSSPTMRIGGARGDTGAGFPLGA